jgi:Ca-activated chloride channel homolog
MIESDRMRRLLGATFIAEAVFWTIAGLLYAARPSDMQFIHPEYFWLLLALPVLLLVFVRRWAWKDRLYDSYRNMGRTRMIWLTFHPWRYFLTWFLLRTTVFFAVMTMAQPAMGSQKIKGSKRVLDLVFCLDISSSMNTMDIAPNTTRLDVAKRAMTQVLNTLKGERIAIVVFANEAYTQLPLTMDYGAAKMFIQEIETSMITAQGTNIGAALEAASGQFADGQSGHAIMVITDGEDHEQLWEEQVEKINKSEIELCYFGIGTERGGKIPIDPKAPELGYKQSGGGDVISRLDPASLRKMGAATGSAVEFSGDPYPDMTGMVAELTSVKNKEVREMEFTIQKNYFRTPLILTILCFIAYLFVPLLMQRRQ